ncbi:EamA-like transporter family protein [Poriferisphaera corsica]|uniref:EamA-like transporter family protein n=1 Tax=Poriferisphaera corsica TaxID=2528020 RepID=A0A517YYZ2_9BACT|nr:hypothetical protein [Poriferisphaera corsica]QDU35427.1 EamA-like transporter family protein [Poriferisphaera corsica]
MLYLALNIIATVIFFQALRFGQVKKLSEMTVSAINYAVGALLSILLLIIAHVFITPQHLTTVALIGGIAMGTIFYVYLFVLFRAYNFFGVGITSALIQMGVTLAAIYAWAFYGQHISAIQWIGLAIIPPALLLMRPKETPDQLTQSVPEQAQPQSSDSPAATATLTEPQTATSSKPNALFVLFILLATALTQTLFAIIHDAVPRFDDNVNAGFLAYTSVIFITGTICNGAHVLVFERKRHKLATYTTGSVAGIANVAICIFLVLSLDVLSSTIVLPTVSVAIIAFNILIARLYWKEPISKVQYFGLAATFLVILLMNIESFLPIAAATP